MRRVKPNNLRFLNSLLYKVTLFAFIFIVCEMIVSVVKVLYHLYFLSTRIFNSMNRNNEETRTCLFMDISYYMFSIREKYNNHQPDFLMPVYKWNYSLSFSGE